MVGRLTWSAHTSGHPIGSVMSRPVSQDVPLAAGPACRLTSMCYASGPNKPLSSKPECWGRSSCQRASQAAQYTSATSSCATQQQSRAHLVLLLEVDKGVARLAVPDVGKSCLHTQPQVITDDLQGQRGVGDQCHTLCAGSPVSRSAYLPVDARDCSSRKGNTQIRCQPHGLARCRAQSSCCPPCRP